jgi:hypothetical protein
MPHPPRRARLALPAVLCLTLVATTAHAKPADPRFSRVSTLVLGTSSGAGLPSCMTGGWSSAPETRVDGFYVEAREVNNGPLWYEPVTLDFSRTTLRLLADDTPGTTVDCVARTITRLTGQDGIAVFQPRFCGHSAGRDVIVSVDGVWLRELPARSTDVDGDGTTGLLDFARVAANVLAGSADPATDFDPCAAGSEGRTTLADLALFARELVREARGTACP